MRSPMLECSPKTWFIVFWPKHPLVTVCVLLLNLVVTLAKSSLMLVFSVEDTPIWACSLSWQPSLRAFSWCSFLMSFLYQSWPICTLVGSENPFLTQQLHENAWYVTVTSHATTLILYLQCSIQCQSPWGTSTTQVYWVWFWCSCAWCRGRTGWINSICFELCSISFFFLLNLTIL